MALIDRLGQVRWALTAFSISLICEERLLTEALSRAAVSTLVQNKRNTSDIYNKIGTSYVSQAIQVPLTIFLYNKCVLLAPSVFLIFNCI